MTLLPSASARTIANTVRNASRKRKEIITFLIRRLIRSLLFKRPCSFLRGIDLRFEEKKEITQLL